MKKPIVTTLITFSTFIIPSVLSTINLSAYASQSAPANQQSINQESLTSKPAIVVYLPTDLVLDAGNKAPRPITLGLAQDFTDRSGNIIPRNSPVSAEIQYLGKAIKINVKGVVYKSQLIPIQASSELIPGDKVTVISGAEKAKQYSSMGGRFGGMALGLMGDGDTSSTFEGALGGAVLGMALGLASPEEKHEVKIPQGSLYVLSLQSPTSQPSVSKALQTPSLQPPVPKALQTSRQLPTPKVSTKFNFKNISQYSAQLKKIVQDYQRGRISREEARSTIEAANKYATTKLRRKLYPPAVLREQVSQIFAFDYPVDRKEK
jgi:hypothetical protein